MATRMRLPRQPPTAASHQGPSRLPPIARASATTYPRHRIGARWVAARAMPITQPRWCLQTGTGEARGEQRGGGAAHPSEHMFGEAVPRQAHANGCVRATVARIGAEKRQPARLAPARAYHRRTASHRRLRPCTTIVRYRIRHTTFTARRGNERNRHTTQIVGRSRWRPALARGRRQKRARDEGSRVPSRCA